MEVANTFYYNDFSLKLIEDALYELSAAKLGMKDRYFLIRTGERGAIQFHKAILQTISGWTQFVFNGDQLGIVEKLKVICIVMHLLLASSLLSTKHLMV